MVAGNARLQLYFYYLRAHYGGNKVEHTFHLNSALTRMIKVRLDEMRTETPRDERSAESRRD